MRGVVEQDKIDRSYLQGTGIARMDRDGIGFIYCSEEVMTLLSTKINECKDTSKRT